MDAAESLKETVTHLFDAVRYSVQAEDMEQAVKKTEADLETDLNALESQTEEVSYLVSSMKTGTGEPFKELSIQIQEFLVTAKEQAKDKLERKAKEEVEEYRGTASSEKDKALKSLETYIASDPLPILEHIVQVRLNEGVYEARSRYQCEGGMKYDFRLASQNSRLFHQELILSQMGYDLKVPVRFSKAILSKSRVPGFERLDQYVLSSAESTSGKIRASFHKHGNSAKIKIITSGEEPNGFVGVEYTDHTQTVNVMNDPSLSAVVDLEAIKKAMGEIIGELTELSKKKVALLKLSLDGEEPFENLKAYEILQLVLKVRGAEYRSVVNSLKENSVNGSNGELTLRLLRDRLKLLGNLSGPVAQSLGISEV